MDLQLEYGAAKDFRDENGWTPLFIASLKGHAQVVKTPINAGTDINFQNVQVIILPSPETDGCVVFSRCDSVDCTHPIFANVCLMIWQFGSTPLMEASKRNHIEVIELLLNADANKDVQDVSRWFLAVSIFLPSKPDIIPKKSLITGQWSYSTDERK